MKRLGSVAVLVAAVSLVTGCAPASSGQQGGDPPVVRPTPQTSYSPEVAATVGLVRGALASHGIRADPPVVPYEPGEPASVADTPRAVLQADVHDPEGGYWLVYTFLDPATAAARGDEFATYLESGFGQTNYPHDAQFALRQVGSTVVFAWWSPELASDRDTADAAFSAIKTVGTEIPVIK
ncbi:MAG: hypothetical protein ABIZ34_04340 [Candidatus Limnocylindrales bacterium]